MISRRIPLLPGATKTLALGALVASLGLSSLAHAVLITATRTGSGSWTDAQWMFDQPTSAAYPDNSINCDPGVEECFSVRLPSGTVTDVTAGSPTIEVSHISIDHATLVVSAGGDQCFFGECGLTANGFDASFATIDVPSGGSANLENLVEGPVLENVVVNVGGLWFEFSGGLGQGTVMTLEGGLIDQARVPEISDGGRMQGSGDISNSANIRVSEAGLVAPGVPSAPIGRLTFGHFHDVNASFLDGGILEVDIAGPTEFDRLFSAEGDGFVFDPGSLIRLNVLGHVPAGSEIDFLEGSRALLVDSTLPNLQLIGRGRVELVFVPGDLEFPERGGALFLRALTDLQPVSEPPTLLLLATLLAALTLMRWRGGKRGRRCPPTAPALTWSGGALTSRFGVFGLRGDVRAARA